MRCYCFVYLNSNISNSLAQIGAVLLVVHVDTEAEQTHHRVGLVASPRQVDHKIAGVGAKKFETIVERLVQVTQRGHGTRHAAAGASSGLGFVAGCRDHAQQHVAFVAQTARDSFEFFAFVEAEHVSGEHGRVGSMTKVHVDRVRAEWLGRTVCVHLQIDLVASACVETVHGALTNVGVEWTLKGKHRCYY